MAGDGIRGLRHHHANDLTGARHRWSTPISYCETEPFSNPCGRAAATLWRRATAVSSSAVLWAQDQSRLFPGREYLPKLLAAPREPTSVAKFVWATDSPTRFGPGIEGEVALGASLPVLLLTGTSVENAIAVGFEAAVFGRFSLKSEKLDFIDSDWVFTVPIIVHRGPHWLRLPMVQRVY